MNSRSGISARQLGALALTASGQPIFRLCCRISWPWVLPGALAAAGTLSALTAAMNRRRKAFPLRGRWPEGPDEVASDQRTGLEFALALVLPAGAVLAAWETTFAFPETAKNLLAAALVLALAGAAAWKGPAPVGRCAGLLLWVTGGLYGTVLIFSLSEIRPEWLVPAGSPLDALRVWGALLLPGAALCLGPELKPGEALPHWSWWAAAGLAAAASAVTGGILSPALARDPEAFRTLARGVSVLGVIRRFEALVNGAMLMSGFAFCTLYLVAAASVLRIYRGRKKTEKKFEKTQKKC